MFRGKNMDQVITMGKGRYLAQLNNYPAKDREMLAFICGASEHSYSFDLAISRNLRVD